MLYGRDWAGYVFLFGNIAGGVLEHFGIYFDDLKHTMAFAKRNSYAVLLSLVLLQCLWIIYSYVRGIDDASVVRTAQHVGSLLQNFTNGVCRRIISQQDN